MSWLIIWKEAIIYIISQGIQYAEKKFENNHKIYQ